ncbi:MAG: 50S ribosomal protein L25, partial [Candidatus Dormibacteraceae bacterium]
MQLTLQASKRQMLGKSGRRLRHQGRLPAVIYGHSQAAQSLEISTYDFERLFNRAGLTQLVDLVVESGRPKKVLIKAVQHSPRTNAPLHVDFQQVSLREKMQVEVPLAFIGEAAGVKTGLGDLMALAQTLRVECLPAAIPEVITVDVSGLAEVDAGIRLGDLELPEGVTAIGDADELLVNIQPSRVSAQ